LTVSLKLAVANKCVKLIFLLFKLFITLHGTYNIGFISGYIAGMKVAIMAKNKSINAIRKVKS
jgi:hypothetical protein